MIMNIKQTNSEDDNILSTSKATKKWRQKGRDVAIPSVKHPLDKLRAKNDPVFFMKNYLPEWFPLEFGEAHLEFIKTFIDCIENNQQALTVLFRGAGKSTIAKSLLLWRIMNYPSQYVVMICASDKATKNHMTSIREELQHNDKLAEDYPEVCEVYKRIGKAAIRANHLTVDGEDCGASFTSTEFKVPYSKDSIVFGNCMQCTTIRSSFRGMQVRNQQTGKIVRPTIILLDDIITDKNASSPDEQDKIEEIINSGIANLAGHSQGMAILMVGTIINANDVVARFSDTDVMPQWHAKKFQAIVNYPETWDSLWKQFFKIRFEEDKNNEIKHEKSNKFYLDNHEAMIKNFKVAWDTYDHSNEIDTYHHWALKYYTIGKDAFQTEYQHSPKQTAGAILEINEDIVLQSVNGREILKTTDEQTIITCGIDVNTRYGLSWSLLASSKTLNSSVINCGVFASNGEFIYSAVASEKSEEECLKIELVNLIDQLVQLPIYTMSGKRLLITAIAIDIGYMSHAIQNLIKQLGESKKYGNVILIPIRGRNEESSMSPNGVIKRGHNFAVVQKNNSSNIVNVLVTNSDAWKENVQQGFFLPKHEDNAISINSNRENVYNWTEYARQICSEQLFQKTFAGKYTKYIWRVKGKNDLLDSTAYARCTAAYCGAVSIKQTEQEELPADIPIKQKVKQSSPVSYDDGWTDYSR